MNADRKTDQRLLAIWKSEGDDATALGLLRSHVITTAAEHHDPITAARALDALELLPHNAGWLERLRPFRERANELLERQRQIDQIGDPGTPVEAIFDVLGDDLNDLDMSAFDVAALHRVRGSKGHAPAALALLEELDLKASRPEAAEALTEVARVLVKRSEEFGCTALFADSRGQGHALGVLVKAGGNGINAFTATDEDMERQAALVLSDAVDGAVVGHAKWMLEWEVAFGGSSIGLPLWIAAQVEAAGWTSDPLLAATGKIDPSGRVRSVDGIAAKVTAAIRHGYRRILVPEENLDEAVGAKDAALEAGGRPDTVQVVPIARLDQVRPALARTVTSATLSRAGMIRLIVKHLPLYGLEFVDQTRLKDRDRIKVTDAAGNGFIDIYDNKRTTVSGGGGSSTGAAARKLVEERLPKDRIQKRGTISAKVRQAGRLEGLVKEVELLSPTVVDPGQHESHRYSLSDSGSTAVMIVYSSGSVVVQGNAPAWDHLADTLLEAVRGLGGADELEAKIHAERMAGAEAEIQTLASTPGSGSTAERSGLISGSAGSAGETFVPHIGTDEAGKGDYFGPLVCAACYVDDDTAAKLAGAGVRDSKKLSDARVHRLAEQIREILPVGRWAVTAINPPRYNTLQREMGMEKRGLNSLVAWGHARSIHQLADHGVWADYVLVDKFADESFFDERATIRDGIRLELRTKAESDIAVAAASILARDRFLNWLATESEKLGMPLPKGAGPPVISAAQNLVAAHGPEVLEQYAKVSFKTTKTVLGQ